MKKIILSIIICLLLSISGTFIVDKISKENWVMQLGYDHVERKLSINYNLLDSYLNLDFAEKFNKFISQLDTDITLKNNNNPCSEARGLNANPQIITRYNDLKFQITIVGKNKELILECEKFIDLQMNKFEKTNLKIAEKLMFYRQKKILVKLI